MSGLGDTGSPKRRREAQYQLPGVQQCARQSALVPERVPADAVVYCDPPYLGSARRSLRQYYQHELLSEGEHEQFLAWARRLPCRVLISGYASELYDSRLPGWRVEEFSAQTRGGTAIEKVWCNFPEPIEPA